MIALTLFGRVAARARRARRHELSFAARAWLLAPAVELSLAAVGVRHTLRAVAAVQTRPPSARSRVSDLDQAAAWVDRAYAVHLLRGQCLPRAVIQHLLHRLDGTPSRLVIGVRPAAGAASAAIDAHAWVEAPDGPGTEPFAAILVLDEAGLRGPQRP